MSSKEIKQNFLLYGKGFLMGVSDLIPGISGGTIAFITGIYERLIRALRNLSVSVLFNFFLSLITLNKKDLIAQSKKIDLVFLLLIFSGIFSAIFLGSSLILYFLNNYESLILIFFIGLIVGSSFVIYEHISDHSFMNRFFSFIGLIFALLIFFLTPQIFNITYFYIFLGGFVSVSALFLPGISGAFILLIMGLYEHILHSVSNFRTEYSNLIIFGSGAILGVYTISRVITYLLDKDKPKTLYFLLGLVIGTLLFPISTIVENYSSSLIDLVSYTLLFILGFLLSLILKKS